MTTEIIKSTILKWHSLKGEWPQLTELEQALSAEGYTVDQDQITELIEMLYNANEVSLQGGLLVAKI